MRHGLLAAFVIWSSVLGGCGDSKNNAGGAGGAMSNGGTSTSSTGMSTTGMSTTGMGGAGSGGMGTMTSTGLAGSAGQAGGGGEADVPREQLGDRVFDEEQVQSYYLTLSDDAYAELMDFSTLLLDEFTVNKDRYVEAGLRVGDVELSSVGLRWKGNYSIWGCVDFATGERVQRVEAAFGDVDVCQRFSLKLDFDQYDDSARLDGLKKLNLHAMSADPTKLRERLAYSLFREMDIVAPRAVHARVYVNGEYLGLFAAVEQVDGRFTANRFPQDGDGNLYKQLWPAPDTSLSAAEDALKTNDDPGMLDVSDFMAFKDAVATANEDDLETALGAYVDFDTLARYIVVDRAIMNYDGIQAFYYGNGWGPYNQNYYWYHASDGQFLLIPWDFDKAFWYPEPNFWTDNAPNGQNIVPNWNVITSSCDGYAAGFDSKIVNNGTTFDVPYRLRQIDCDPLLRLLRGEIYERQAALAADFIAGPFSSASVSAKVEAWRTQIATAVEEDPLVDSTHWQSSVDSLLADLPRFQDNLSLMMSGLITE